jgi:flagellar hook-length control protein FliK
VTKEMEIQAQTPMNSVNQGQTACTGASSVSGTTNQPNGFSTALQTIMAVGKEDASLSPIPSVLALLQMVMPAMNAKQLPEDQLFAMTEEQMDGMIQLLEAADSDTTDELLQNPELQAWLSQIQSVLAQLQHLPFDAASVEPTTDVISGVEEIQDEVKTSLNPMLFVPLDGSELNAPEAQGTSAPLNKAEALQVLTDFKQLLHTASTEANTDVKQAVKQAVNQFSTVVMAMQPAEVIQKDTTSPEENLQKTVIHVAATAVQKLEYLAAKTVTPKFAVETTEQSEALFEPLVPLESDGEAHPIPFQDFLKQVQPNQQAVRMPFVQMPAATFTEDMTQFIVNSFSIESSAEGFTEAKLSLYPQHLGHVEVKLSMQNGHLIAQFVADHAAGKEMLENQLSQLRTTLQNQGIQVDKLEVTQSQSFQSGMFQEQRQQQSQQSSKQQKSGSNNKDTLETDLIDGVDPTTRNTSINRNGAIDYTA